MIAKVHWAVQLKLPGGDWATLYTYGIRSEAEQVAKILGKRLRGMANVAVEYRMRKK